MTMDCVACKQQHLHLPALEAEVRDQGTGDLGSGEGPPWLIGSIFPGVLTQRGQRAFWGLSYKGINSS